MKIIILLLLVLIGTEAITFTCQQGAFVCTYACRMAGYLNGYCTAVPDGYCNCFGMPK
jgi:hypothetical protein